MSRDLPELLSFIRVGIKLGQRSPGGFRQGEQAAPRHAGYYWQPDGLCESLHDIGFVLHPSAVEDDARNARDALVEVPYALQYVVRRVYRHELAGCDKIYAVGVLIPQGDCEPAADHVAQHIIELHAEIHLVYSEVLQCIKGAQDASPGAPYAGFGPSSLDAPDTPHAVQHYVLKTSVVRCGPSYVVKYGGLFLAVQEKAGRIVLGVASYLQYLLPQTCQEIGDVGGYSGFAYPALSVHGHLNQYRTSLLNTHDIGSMPSQRTF